MLSWKKNTTKVRNNSHWLRNDTQKQPPRGVISIRCSENMQQIYWRTPIPNIFLEHLFLGTPLAGWFWILTFKINRALLWDSAFIKTEIVLRHFVPRWLLVTWGFPVLCFGLLTDATQTRQTVNSLRQKRQPVASALL